MTYRNVFRDPAREIIRTPAVVPGGGGGGAGAGWDNSAGALDGTVTLLPGDWVPTAAYWRVTIKLHTVLGWSPTGYRGLVGVGAHNDYCWFQDINHGSQNWVHTSADGTALVSAYVGSPVTADVDFWLRHRVRMYSSSLPILIMYRTTFTSLDGESYTRFGANDFNGDIAAGGLNVPADTSLEIGSRGRNLNGNFVGKILSVHLEESSDDVAWTTKAQWNGDMGQVTTT